MKNSEISHDLVVGHRDLCFYIEYMEHRDRKITLQASASSTVAALLPL